MSTEQQQTPAPVLPGLTPAPQTNTLALVALILAIMSITTLCGLASPVAVVLGHRARGQIRRTGEQGAGMALAGTIVGYVGTVGLVLLAVFIGVSIAADS